MLFSPQGTLTDLREYTNFEKYYTAWNSHIGSGIKS